MLTSNGEDAEVRLRHSAFGILHSVSYHPRRIDRSFVLPLRAALVVDLPLGEQPLPIHLHEVVLVVTETTNRVGTLGIVVPGVEPGTDLPTALLPSIFSTMFVIW